VTLRLVQEFSAVSIAYLDNCHINRWNQWGKDSMLVTVLHRSPTLFTHIHPKIPWQFSDRCKVLSCRVIM